MTVEATAPESENSAPKASEPIEKPFDSTTTPADASPKLAADLFGPPSNSDLDFAAEFTSSASITSSVSAPQQPFVSEPATLPSSGHPSAAGMSHRISIMLIPADT